MTLAPGSLVLYKQKSARVLSNAGDKIEIETPGGTVRVRPKDVLPLHPGPVTSLAALHAPSADPAEVWALLEGEALPLADVAELAFGAFTPDSALAVWGWVQDGTYFTGTPAAITPRDAAAVNTALAAEQAKAEEARAWEAHLDALRRGEVGEARRLADVEALALGRTQKSRTLAALGRPETPSEAHALLLRVHAWDETRNPYPSRFGVDTEPVARPVPPAPDDARLDTTARPAGTRLDTTARPAGTRLDLTHLPAYAIDDEGSSDPDDAISLERTSDGYRLWVHVADAALLAPANSDLDEEARRRGATLYLPEGTVPMLPPAVTEQLALGLTETSPALSFALDLDAHFAPLSVDVHLTRLRVTRLTYAQAQAQLHEPHLADLAAFARAARAHREAAGAVRLELPEVRVRVNDGQVSITPLPPLESRGVVQEAMMLAGWGAATWAQERDLALPFAAQDPPLDHVEGDSLPAQWARRKTLARTRFAPSPAPHAGLGLERYAQATSPLRRYLDLVVHQQIRAELAGERPLSGADIAARAAQADLAAGSVRAAERATNRHWTLVHLRRQPDWHGRGVTVERRGPVATLLLPDLALDVTLPTPSAVGETLELTVAEVDLPNLTLRLRPWIQ